MSKNNIDDMMKSVLGNAQEEAPAHVWNGISNRLDKIASRRTVSLWWRRAVISSAAAAVILLAFLFRPEAEQPLSQEQTLTPPEQVLMAEVNAPVIPDTYFRPLVENTLIAKEIPSHTNEAPAVEEPAAEEPAAEEPAVEAPAAEISGKEDIKPIGEDWAAIEWEEEDAPAKKTAKVSVVLSGITGTNGIQDKARASIMKRPSLSGNSIKTGIAESSTNSTFGIPVSAGLGVKIDFNDKWSIGIGANYSLLTRKFYGTYTKAENGVELSSIDSDIRNSQHYLGLPVNVFYNIVGNKHINLYTYAGGTIEKCLSDQYSVLSADVTHTEHPKGIQLSANLGIGVEFMLTKHLGIYADPSLRYYFNNHQPKSIRTAQPLMLGVEIGLRIR